MPILVAIVDVSTNCGIFQELETRVEILTNQRCRVEEGIVINQLFRIVDYPRKIKMDNRVPCKGKYHGQVLNSSNCKSGAIKGDHSRKKYSSCEETAHFLYVIN